jgi:hypothetical protein
MSKLVVFLYGGLGNQIFQYAHARKIADQYGFKLILNTYGFEIDNYYKRSLELLNFDISYDNIESGNKFFFQLSRFIQHFPICNRIIKFFLPQLIIEKTNKFENNYIKINSKIKKYFLFGYWHDERYFSDISSSLKSSFSNISSLSIRNCNILNSTYVNSSVFVHMRFTHMLKSEDNKITNKKFQVDEEYYFKSFEYFINNFNNIKFYIFSDKPIFAKEFMLNFDIDYVILENDRGPDYQDIYMMSKFKYHIIANSSFSWWGAWLSLYSDDNITIAPNNTLFTPSIPSNWLTLN